MADEQAKKAKRRVKSPETFRERALRATDTQSPARLKKRNRPASKAFGALAAAFRRLSGRKSLRPARRVLGLVGKVIFPVYFRNSWRELHMVTWPNWRESRRLTVAVLIFAIVFGAAVAGVDWGLDRAFKQLLLK